IFNPDDRQAKPSPGNVAFISQSGALGAAVLDWLSEAGVGMSKFVSYGNAADIKEWELIDYLADDEKTKVITAYIEGVEEGVKFLQSIRKAVSKRKPVIVLKAGKSSKGLRAVASHTGSLAGRYEVYESALKQYGALVVKELNELIVAAKALSWLPVPKGERIAIVTNGGGAGVLATDAIELLGLTLAELGEDTKSKLRSKLPPAASVENPVDVLGDAPPERYEVAIEEVLRDKNVDAVLVIGIMQSPAFDPEGVLKVLRNCVSKYDKPIVVAAPGGEYTVDKLRRIEREVKIPTFRTPEEAVKALWYVVRWSRTLRRLGVSADKS
ncbi:MAG: CoA-binding protein, partial [Desulfurococcales archaeon]|nr:CoA-binding protein [Desulfurococcales archaeon]